MTDKDFYLSAGYLTSPKRSANIEAEMPPTRQKSFIVDYAEWTNNNPLPLESNVAPYYVLKEGVNKYGLELRVYFHSESNMPDCLDDLLESKKTQGRHGYERWNRRISKSPYIIRLLEVGFVLGPIQNVERIKALIPEAFINDFEAGFNLG